MIKGFITRQYDGKYYTISGQIPIKKRVGDSEAIGLYPEPGETVWIPNQCEAQVSVLCGEDLVMQKLYSYPVKLSGKLL